MKLSQYAKKTGISYKTAWRWWKAGHLKAYQAPSGTVIVNEKQSFETNKEKKTWKRNSVKNVNR